MNINVIVSLAGYDFVQYSERCRGVKEVLTLGIILVGSKEAGGVDARGGVGVNAEPALALCFEWAVLAAAAASRLGNKEFPEETTIEG